jgi:hypothetical protein
LNVLQGAATEWFLNHGVDAAAAFGALLYVRYKRSRELQPGQWVSLHTGLQFFSGLAVVPLVLLFFGAFSETVLRMLVRTNGIVLAGAAAVALFAILEDRES